MVRLPLAALLLAIACLCRPAAAQPAAEEAVRAAMVFNFLKFTEFPAEAVADTQRLRLCYSVGEPAQAEALAALSGRRIGSRELAVVRLDEHRDNCQVLYVDSRQRWNAALESRGIGTPLTIGSYRGFVADGGMIEMDLQNDGTRFEINLAQARLAHFHMSPQLLRLARRIHE